MDKKKIIQKVNEVVKFETRITEQLDNLAKESELNKNCIFNINALNNINKLEQNIFMFGDSIGHGSGSDNGGAYGFAQMARDTGYAQTHGFYEVGASWYGTWNKTNEGTFGLLKVSNTGGDKIGTNTQSDNHPKIEYKLSFRYSKRPDGGVADIIVDGVENAIGSINFQGESQECLLAEFTIPANKKAWLTVRDGQKAYVLSCTIKPSTPGNVFINYSRGGAKSSDFSKEMFNYTLKGYKPDTLIWEFISNDYGQNKLNDYKDRTLFVVELCKSMNTDFIFIIPCGQSGCETSSLWKEFKNFIYKTARDYNCCVIDYDILFGGYNRAKPNGLIADSIHPTTKGYIAMADILCQVLYQVSCLNTRGLNLINHGDFRNKQYGMVAFNNTGSINGVYYAKEYKQVNNNPWVYGAYTDMAITHISTNNRYPNNVPKGNFILEEFQTKILCNKGDRMNQNWVIPRAYGMLERMDSLPSASDSNLDRLYVLNNSVRDKVFVYLKGDGSSLTNPTRGFYEVATTDMLMSKADSVIPQITKLSDYANDANIGKLFRYNGQIICYMSRGVWKSLQLGDVN